MRASALVLLCAVLVTCASCKRAAGPPYSSVDEFPLEKAQELRNKSRAEIRATLGEPTKSIPDPKRSDIWEYAGKKQVLVVVFGYGEESDRAEIISTGATKDEAYEPFVQRVEPWVPPNEAEPPEANETP